LIFSVFIDIQKITEAKIGIAAGKTSGNLIFCLKRLSGAEFIQRVKWLSRQHSFIGPVT